MTKLELIQESKKICEKSPKNSSQIIFGLMFKNKLDQEVLKCRELANQYNLPFAAGLFLYLNDLREPPKCIDCQTEIPRFISLNIGFNKRCKKCGTLYSHQHLSIVNKNKSQSTIEKLRESNKRTAEKKKQDQLNYQYIELSQDNLNLAYQQAQLAHQNGYLTHPMDNLKLSKMRKEYPHMMEIVKSLIHNKKVVKPNEALYWLLHQITERPHCKLHLGDKCGDNPTFIDLEKGYHEACGNCSKHKPESRLKAQTTSLKNWGTSNPMKSKENIEKRKSNNIEKYGVSHPMKLKEFQDKRDDTNEKLYGVRNVMENQQFVDKRMSTLIEKYGEHPISNSEIQEKMIQSYIEHYGVPRFQSTEEFKEKLRDYYRNDETWVCKRETAKEDLKLFRIELLETPSLLKEDVKFRCMTCGYTGVINITRIQCGHTWICPNCYPVPGNHSKSEYDILRTIQTKFPNIRYEIGNRSILNGKELDLYFPDYNIAIEYNGCMYHSVFIGDNIDRDNTDLVDKQYHYNKWKLCKENGVELVTIFDDDWIIVKYRKVAIPLLLSKFGFYENSVNVNICQIVNVHDEIIIYKFLSNNTLDRFNEYSNAIAIMYDNKIIAMLCYQLKDNHYDIRYCNVKNYKIENGFQKLLNRFITENPFEYLTYSVNRDWTDKPDLEKFGFTIYNDSENYNRFYWGVSLWKRKMIQDFNDRNREMLKSGKVGCVCDCGNTEYRLYR